MKQTLLTSLLLLSAFYLSGDLVFAQSTSNIDVTSEVKAKIRIQNERWVQSQMGGDIQQLIKQYDQNAIYMPEYQPTLNGIAQIKAYFTSLAKRRKVDNMNLYSQELIALKDHVLEIGMFETSITWSATQHSDALAYTGKYWKIWKTFEDGTIKLIGEAFGFFSPIQNSEFWVTDMSTKKSAAPSGFKPADASIELKAYHSIGQKGVQQKNGLLRSQLYADDGVFYPYAETEKRGIDVLRPYLIQYSSHGAIINSVQTHTHDVLYLNNYILEFGKFSVTWTYDETPVQANGKGIALRKRLENGELRIYRHIGMHNFEGG